MEQVKQTDEEFVRGVWEWVQVRPAEPFEGIAQGRWTVRIPRLPFSQIGFDIETEAWSAAAAFTRERLEEVRELREEIECVKEQQSEWAGCTGAPELLYYACWTRTLARLESILADKTSGMKAGA